MTDESVNPTSPDPDDRRDEPNLFSSPPSYEDRVTELEARMFAVEKLLGSIAGHSVPTPRFLHPRVGAEFPKSVVVRDDLGIERTHTVETAEEEQEVLHGAKSVQSEEVAGAASDTTIELPMGEKPSPAQSMGAPSPSPRPLVP